MSYENDNWDTVIYIDGAKHRATGLGLRFFVDSESLPCRRCAQHGLDRAAVAHLKLGGKVRTSGHWYSLTPDKEDK